jgi:hypothetical protein
LYSNSYYGSSSSYGRSSRIDNLSTVLVTVFLALVAVILGTITFNALAVSGSADGCTVTKMTETKGTKGHMHRRIYTEGCNGSTEQKVFSVEHNWFAGQFDPKGAYSKLEIGKTYDFVTRGSRIELIGSFENIVGVSGK